MNKVENILHKDSILQLCYIVLILLLLFVPVGRVVSKGHFKRGTSEEMHVDVGLLVSAVGKVF